MVALSSLPESAAVLPLMMTLAGCSYPVDDFTFADSSSLGDARPDTSSPDGGSTDATATDASFACDPGHGDVSSGGHCYWRALDKRSWSDAAAACASRGAHLVTIRSNDEEKVVAALCGTAECWIGASRAATGSAKKDFRWIDGEPNDFDGWKPGEPNGTGLCARETSTGWADSDCGTLYDFICEHD